MLYLKNLKIDCFGSIVDQYLEIKGSGLYSLHAFNRDTGGSSGAGKSTLFKSLEYILCLIPSPKTYKNRLTGKNPDVTASFLWDGKELKIRRFIKGSTNEMEIWIDNQLVSNGGKESEEYLYSKIIKMPKQMLKRLLHKPQGEKMFFAYLTPSQIFEYMLQILEMENCEAIAEKASEHLKSLEKSIEQNRNLFIESKNKKEFLEKEIDSYELLLKNKKEVLENLTKEKTEMTDRLSNLFKEKDLLQSTIEEKKKLFLEENKQGIEKLSKELKFLSSQKELLQADQKQAISVANKDLEDLKKQLEVLNKNKAILEREGDEVYLKELGFLEKELGGVDNKIAHLQNEKCPTCLRQWDESLKELEVIKEKRSLLNQQIQDIKNKMQTERQSREEKLGFLLKQIGSLTEQIELKNKEIKEIELKYLDKIKELDSKINTVKENIDSEKQSLVNNLKDILNETSLRLNELLSEEKTLQKKLEEKALQYNEVEKECVALNTKLNILKKDLQNLKDAASSLESKILQEEEDLEIYKSIKDEVRSFVLYNFETFLSSMVQRANEIMHNIPNSKNITISFSLSKESQSGKIKEGVNLKFYDSGLEVPLDTFSGGEQTTIGLALDIAFSEELSKFNSNYLNIWMLDEPFDGLDLISKISFLDILKTYTNRVLIVVEHDSVINEYAENKIIVEKADGFSYISN